MAERERNLNTHVNNDVVKAAMDIRVAHQPKSRNTKSEYLVQDFVILELLLILSKLNVQYINKSVYEF